MRGERESHLMRLDLMMRKPPTAGTGGIAVWKYLLTMIHIPTVQGYDENLLLFIYYSAAQLRRDRSNLETPPIQKIQCSDHLQIGSMHRWSNRRLRFGHACEVSPQVLNSHIQ